MEKAGHVPRAFGFLVTGFSGLELHCSDDGWLGLRVALQGSHQLCFGYEGAHLSPAPDRRWRPHASALSQVPVTPISSETVNDTQVPSSYPPQGDP